MDDDKKSKPNQNQEMNRTCALPASKQFAVNRPPIDDRWGHGEASEDGKRSHHIDGSGIGQLLEGVISVEGVWFGRKPKVGVINEKLPGLGEHAQGSRHQPMPMTTRQACANKEDTRQYKSVDCEEVPGSSQPHRVPITWRGESRSELARVCLRGTECVLRNLYRSQSQPGSGRRAVIV